MYSCDFKKRTNVLLYETLFWNKCVNFALVKSIKAVLNSITILGRDVSEKENVNLFFSSGMRGSHRREHLGYDIKFPQVFAVFCAQSSSTSHSKDDLNNEHPTSEMSRSTNIHKNWNWNGVLRKHRTIVLTRLLARDEKLLNIFANVIIHA